MLSEASSLVRHQCTRLPKYRCSQRPRPWLDTMCTRLPKYRCSQRPRPWLDTSALVFPSIDAPRSFRMLFSMSGTVVKATTTTGFGLLLTTPILWTSLARSCHLSYLLALICSYRTIFWNCHIFNFCNCSRPCQEVIYIFQYTVGGMIARFIL